MIIGGDRSPDGSTQGTADNRAIPAAQLIAKRRPGSATNTTAYGGIQRGVAGVRLNDHEYVHKCHVSMRKKTMPYNLLLVPVARDIVNPITI